MEKQEFARLLELRRKSKKRMPLFVVKASWFCARVKKRWRFPGGRHSPIRQEHRGRPKLVRPGYGSPRAVKGLHPSGLRPVLVRQAKDLVGLDKAVQGVIIGGKLGAKKRIELLQLAQKEKITVLNVKDITADVNEVKEQLAARKKLKAETSKEKDKKHQEKEKAAEKKKKEQEEKKKEGASDHHGHDHSLEESVGGSKSDHLEEERKEAEKTLTKPQ